jgi:hypothetical protein
MNRDEIIRMAQESELWLVIDQHCCEYGDGLPTLDCYPELERFAALVAAVEREACAKLCEQKSPVKGGEIFAARIRARGDQ